jgi:hypothetical protein
MKLQDIARRSLQLQVGGTVKRANDPAGFYLLTKAWGKAAMPNSTIKFRGLRLKFSKTGRLFPEAVEETLHGLTKDDWQIVGSPGAEREAFVSAEKSSVGVQTFKLDEKAVELAKQQQPPFDFTAENTKARELSAAFKAARKEKLAAQASETTQMVQELAKARAALKQKKAKAQA